MVILPDKISVWGKIHASRFALKTPRFRCEPQCEPTRRLRSYAQLVAEPHYFLPPERLVAFARRSFDRTASSSILNMRRVCCHMMPSNSISSRHASVWGCGSMRNNSPARSAMTRLLPRRDTNGGKFSAPAKVKNACLLRSPCFTALVLPNGAPAPARFPPQPDLDCWFDFFIFRTASSGFV